MSTGSTTSSARRQALLEKMVKKEGAALSKSGITPLPRDTDRFAASYSQQRIWFLEQLIPETPAYNVPISHRLHGELDVRALTQSLERLVSRHETLRTHFQSIDGVLYQVIDPVGRFDMTTVDLRGLEEPELTRAIQERVRAEERKVFDLSKGPLFTALLLRIRDDENGLVLNMHHSIADGWSHGIILRELDTCYAAYAEGREPELEPMHLQYADYAHWQSTKNFDRDIGYWREVLAGTLPVLDLPLDRARPVRQTNNGESIPIQISFDTLEKLRDLGRREGSSVFMTLLAAFEALLFRYTGQTDLSLGSTITGRTQKEEYGIIGDFVNILPLRTSLAGNPTFRELLERVRTTATGAYSHQSLPFDRIVESISPGRSQIFQISFGVNSLSMPDVGIVSVQRMGPLQVSGLHEFTSVSSKLDLLIYLWETPGSLSGYVEYNTDLFDRTTIEQLVESYQIVADEVVANPDVRLLELSLPHRSGISIPTVVTPPLPGLFEEPSDAIEEVLCKIWEETLGLERVSLDDNFFDLGGHSLLAFRLMGRIKQEFDPSISIAETFKAPTIRTMARMIRLRNQGHTKWSPVVPLKPQGTRPPLFCAPVYGGSAFYYRTLSSFIDEDQPLYALEPIGLNGVDEPHTTVEEMAAYYITHIRTIQPKGPYALCGLSLGGVIAFEMARQLIEAGDDMGCVIMFDSLSPGFYGTAAEYKPGKLEQTLKRIRYTVLSQIDEITAWPTLGDRLGHATSTTRKFVRRIRNRLKGLPWKEAYVHPNSLDLPEAYHKVIAAEERAIVSYRPKSYPGRVVLIKAHLPAPDVKTEVTEGWIDIAPGLEVVPTPGTHFTMLEEPCVRISAAHLHDILEAVQKKP